MFKNFFILALSAIMGTGGCLPFAPIIETKEQEKYYCDVNFSGQGSGEESFDELITFDTYSVSLTTTDILCPCYGSSYGTNGCTPTAGSIMVAYYDYYYPNLLPDYNPTYTYDGNLYWEPQNSTITNMQIDLFNRMGTNTIQPGTSVAQFKTGMTSYFNSQGYSISYNNVSSSITPTNVVNYFNQEKPIILFLTSYEYFPDDSIFMTENSMDMLGYRKTVGHAVVAFGYVEYLFYTDNALTRTDKYLYVIFGDSTMGYLSINSTSYIQEAYTFTIT